jgi:hypothetical protein
MQLRSAKDDDIGVADLAYRRRLAVAALFSLIWLTALLIGRWEYLWSPPYVEHVGWWEEASYLVDHQFNYRKLAAEQHGSVGGPRNYLSSALPGMLALAMSFGGPNFTLPLVHVGIFLAASLSGGFVVWLMLPLVGTIGSLLSGIVLGTIPIMYVQTELPSMDVAMLGALIPSFVLLEKRRLTASAIASIPAFLIKNSAFLFPASIGLYSGLTILLAISSRQSLSRADGRHLMVSGLVVLAEYTFVAAAGNTESRVRFFFDIILWLQSTPELALLLAASLFMGLYWFRTVRREGTFLNDCWRPHPFYIVGGILQLVTYTAVLATAFEARYLIMTLPFLIYSLVLPMTRWWGRGSIIPKVILSAWILFNLSNLDGRWLIPMDPQVARGWGIPERSLEYRADHRANISFCQRLESEGRGKNLLVGEQFVFFLQSPRVGYVQRGLAGPVPPYFFVAEDTNVEKLLDDSPDDIVVAYVPSQLGELGFPAFRLSPPTEDDVVLEADGLVPENVIYRRRLPTGLTWSQRCRRTVDLLFANAKELDPAGRLAVVGYEKQARRLIAEDLHVDASSPKVTIELKSRLGLMGVRAASRLRDPSSRASVEQLVKIIARRRGELDRNEPLAPLTWVERGLDEFIPQRFRYMPALEGPDPPKAHNPSP